MTDSTRPTPAPLAACGVVLAALAIAGLARGYELDRSEPGEGGPPAPVRVPSPPDAGPSPSQVRRLLEQRPMDLNAATADDLRLLPRIGPTLAARIIEDRGLHGAFRSVDDLARVRGIGPRTLEGIRPLATAGPPEPGPPAPGAPPR